MSLKWVQHRFVVLIVPGRVPVSTHAEQEKLLLLARANTEEFSMKSSNTPATATTAKVQGTTMESLQLPATTATPTALPASTSDMEHRQAFLEEVKKASWKLRRSIYSDDKEFVLAVVSNEGEALRFASVNLRADKDVVLAAAANNGYDALKYASENLQADKDVVLAAATNDGASLYYASVNLLADKDVVLAAATNDGNAALEYASENLQADKEVVLAAATNAGDALYYASENLRADKEVVLAAAADNGVYALAYASENLQADKEVVLAAVTNYGYALKYASVNLQADKDVVLAAAANDGNAALEYASENLQADKEVVLAAATNAGRALQYAPGNLRADKDVVLAAAANDGDALEYASENLRADRDVILAAATANGRALQFAPRDVLDCTMNDNLDFVRTVIQAYSGRFDLDYFPGLESTLSTLYSKLRASGQQGSGIFQWQCCGDALPQVVAKQWLAHLLETRWCLEQACRNRLASNDIQQHALEFSGLSSDFQTAGLLQTYAPVICAVLEKHHSVSSWLELLEECGLNDSDN